jgi:hypothetical protein
MLPSLTALGHWPVGPVGVHFGEAAAAAATIRRVVDAPSSSWGWWREVADALAILRQLPPEELSEHRPLLLTLMGPEQPDLALEALEAFLTLPSADVAASLGPLREVVRAWAGRPSTATSDQQSDELLYGILAALASVTQAVHSLRRDAGMPPDATPFAGLALEQLGSPLLRAARPVEELVALRERLDASVYDVLRHLPLDERLAAIVAYAASHRDAASVQGVSNVLHMVDSGALHAWRGVVVHDLPQLVGSDLPEVVAWARLMLATTSAPPSV